MTGTGVAEGTVLQRLAARLLPLGTAQSGGTLGRIAWRHAGLLPAILVLGLLASLLEGFGISMLIPLVALLTGTGLPAGVPEPVRWAAGLAQGAGLADAMLIIGLVILALILVKGVIQIANAALISSVDTRAGDDVRAALSRHLLALDYRFFLEHDASRLVTILKTDAWYGMESVRAHLEILVACASIVVFTALLIWLDWQLFAMVLVAVAAIRAAHFLLERRVRRLGDLVTGVNARFGAQMLVIINAARPIRIYGQQEAEQRRFESQSGELRGLFAEIDRASAWATASVEFLIALVFVTILVIASRVGWSIATVSAFLVLLYRSQPHLANLARARVRVASRRGSLREVEWLLSQNPARAAARPSGHAPLGSLEQPIAFDKASYHYPNGAPGLSEASFVIAPHSTTALIGRSGSGKSTVVNLICRLLGPDSGRVLLGDEPAERFALPDWLGRIGLAGQDVALVAGSVAYNIAYGEPGASRERIEAAARAASAHDFVAKLPGGYDALVGEEGVNLSTGQRQRIGIARALLRKPDLLILDEATSAVDAIAEGEIMRLLADRSHYKTAVVISHRRSTLLACSDGIVLENGRVREAGPLPQLRYFAEMAGDGHE